MRTPTEKQHRSLLTLGSGAAGLSWTKRHTESLLRHGWVTAEAPDENDRYRFYQWVRITPQGLRALALSVEKYGLPDLSPKQSVPVRVCAECGSDRFRSQSRPAEEVMV